jgi:hypothetical protein
MDHTPRMMTRNQGGSAAHVQTLVAFLSGVLTQVKKKTRPERIETMRGDGAAPGGVTLTV